MVISNMQEEDGVDIVLWFMSRSVTGYLCGVDRVLDRGWGTQHIGVNRGGLGSRMRA